uniref:SbcD-like subunit of palindrome specific endonuclease n=1 Tax=Ochrobactrum phage ORM_20 TaxID=2985243 RepID=A0A9N6WSK4_9VIRU|nr:SbcD-like subunit of palindrome specific endonuclease [Ochrobactrum phage ORM_20]
MKAIITGDWHIGKTSAKVDHEIEFRRAFDWMIKEADRLGVKNIIHTGDLWDTKRYLSFAMVRLWKYVLETLEEYDLRLYIANGNHDVPNVKKMNESLFTIAESSDRVLDFGFTSKWKIDDETVLFIPYGLVGEVEGSTDGVSLCICHESRPPVYPGVLTVSGHIHQRSSLDGAVFSGTLYQLEREQVDQSTGFILYDSGSYEYIDNPHKTFRRVELIEGKIEGLNPVKWVMNNRSALAGANLEVKVDELTDKTLYQKLVAILETVALNDLVLTEAIEFSQEPLKNSSHDAVSLISSELNRPGAKLLLEEIAGKLR